MSELLLRRRIAIINSTPSLPYDAEVEYLESSGTQYIDTGIIKTAGTSNLWIAKAGFDTSYSGVRKFVAAYNNSKCMYYCEFNQTQFGGVGWNVRYFCDPSLSSLTLYDVSMLLETGRNTYTVKVNDEIATKVAAPTQLYDVGGSSFLLFCLLPAQYVGSGVMIGENQLLIDGVVVRDYIPVRVGQVGYMYDKISGQLFGNNGTGDFILGNDVN